MATYNAGLPFTLTNHNTVSASTAVAGTQSNNVLNQSTYNGQATIFSGSGSYILLPPAVIIEEEVYSKDIIVLDDNQRRYIKKNNIQRNALLSEQIDRAWAVYKINTDCGWQVEIVDNNGLIFKTGIDFQLDAFNHDVFLLNKLDDKQFPLIIFYKEETILQHRDYISNPSVSTTNVTTTMNIPFSAMCYGVNDNTGLIDDITV